MSARAIAWATTTPTQVKMFWWGRRYHVNPYSFEPAGNERSGFHETGAGTLAEFDVLGRGRTVAGVNALIGTSAKLDRTMIGPYARLGFGKWGIFAEHDITTRTLNKPRASMPFRQAASYAQVSGRRANVWSPYRESLTAAGFQLSSRLSPHLRRPLARAFNMIS